MTTPLRSLLCLFAIPLVGCHSSDSGGSTSTSSGSQSGGAGGASGASSSGDGGSPSATASSSSGAGGAMGCGPCGVGEECDLSTMKCTSSCVGAQPGAPWPMVGRCASRRGLSPVAGAQTGKIKWKVSLPPLIESRPAITIDANGFIYVPCSTLNGGHLWVVSKYGTLWSVVDFGALYVPPVVGKDGTLYVTSYGDYKLHALNPVDLSELWSLTPRGGEVNESAVRADGAIMTIFGNKVSADAPAGQPLWTFDLGNSTVYQSPALAPDSTTYITSGDSDFFALKPDGTIKYMHTFSPQQPAGAATVADDGTAYVIHGRRMAALSPSGNEIWDAILDAQAPQDSGLLTQPGIGPDGTIYVPDPRPGGSLYAIAPNDGSVKWSFKLIEYGASMPAIGADGTVYLATGGDSYLATLYAIRPDGTELWSYPGPCGEPAIGADGTTYAVCNGSLVAFGP